LGVCVSFGEVVEYLYGLQKFGVKLGLENTRELLNMLGNPDAGPRFLHVTGTNGKGSVCALVASALTAAGHKTGLYTSPHLVSFTERMRLDGVEVTEDELVALADRLKGLVAATAPDMKPTFFEFTTAMAFDWFGRSGADVVALEVGMGGRLDSTNVVTPVCSVITNVEMEHAEYLGDTIEKVAFEKAGIIKPGVPLVTAEKKPAVMDYLSGVCSELGSDMLLLGRDFGFSPKGQVWQGARPLQMMDYTGPGGSVAGVEVPLPGPHQLINAATAACALQVMDSRGVRCDGDAIRTGFRAARHDGRLEVVSERPLLVLDGAHNPASAICLADAVRESFKGRYNKLYLVMGALSDKDTKAMLKILAPLADTLVLTRAEYERAVEPDQLAEAAKGLVKEVVVKPKVSEALKWALSNCNKDDMVLVAGSLYVVGEAKEYLGDKARFLRA